MKKTANTRNIINANEIKEVYANYAEEKDFPEALARWLSGPFAKWVINEHPNVTPIHSEQDYISHMKEQPPGWFLEKLNQVAFYYIDIWSDPDLHQSLSRVVEWLQVNEPTMGHKFQRMTVPHVLQKWQEDHERFQKQLQNGYYPTSGEALKEVLHYGKNHIVEFDATHPEFRKELANESQQMQHCIGQFQTKMTLTGGYGEFYAEAALSGKNRLFSIRDEFGKSHVTISLQCSKNMLTLDQIKGKQNKPPIEKYHKICARFLNFFKVSYGFHWDATSMGLFYSKGKTLRVEEIEEENLLQNIIGIMPQLIHKIENPSEALQWIAYTKQPKLLSQAQTDIGDDIKMAALLLDPTLMGKTKLNLPITAKDIAAGFAKIIVNGRRCSLPSLHPNKA